MLKYKELTSGTVLFGLSRKTLDDKAKTSLDDLAKQIGGADRFVIEIQGYTDKTGDLTFNEALSQDRAQSVARYLASEHNVPLRAITVLGQASPLAIRKTRDERAQARKVDVRIYVPETASAATTASN